MLKKSENKKNTNIHKKNPCAKSTQTKTIPRPIAFLKWFSSPCPQLLSWLEQTNSSSCPQRWSPGYGSIGQDSPCAWGHLESVCRYQSEEITRRCYSTGGICTWTVHVFLAGFFFYSKILFVLKKFPSWYVYITKHLFIIKRVQPPFADMFSHCCYHSRSPSHYLLWKLLLDRTPHQ